jgi:hypothetical protein
VRLGFAETDGRIVRTLAQELFVERERVVDQFFANLLELGRGREGMLRIGSFRPGNGCAGWG